MCVYVRGTGGLLVSANRTAGAVKFVRILSEQGGTVVLRVHGDPRWQSSAAPTAIPPSVKVTTASATRGEWKLTLAKGQHVVLHMGGATAPPLVIAPVVGNSSEFNWWGFTREMQPLH